jgi:hypothetical protein
MYSDAVESYRLAKEYADRYLGKEDAITMNLTNIYLKAKREIDIHIEKN